MQEVGCVVVVRVWWNAIDVIVLYRHCLWASGGWLKFLEKGPPRGTGWCCCGCVVTPPFRPSFQSTEYIKCTLPALAATLLQQT